MSAGSSDGRLGYAWCMDAFRAQRQALLEDLRGLAAVLKRAERQKREADESGGGEGPQRGPWNTQTAAIVSHLSGLDGSAASEYVQLARRNRPRRGAGQAPHWLDAWARRAQKTVCRPLGRQVRTRRAAASGARVLLAAVAASVNNATKPDKGMFASPPRCSARSRVPGRPRMRRSR